MPYGYISSPIAKNTESEVSKAYVKALSNVVSHGVCPSLFWRAVVVIHILQTKMVYVASLNDQVVPVWKVVIFYSST